LSIKLEKSIIGKTTLEITKIGMGGAPLGSLDENTARKTLEKAYESGLITLIQLHYMGQEIVKNFMGIFYLV